ncbi:MAG: exodeoxyribonuclease VII small subunit [Cellulosilyticaceae bacterium]
MAKKQQKHFEGALEALEAIIYELESGTLTLEESIKHYKNGIELAAFCSEALKKAEQEVYLLEKEGFKKVDGELANE